jgi:NADH:ubiquinone oxidoreductase subunit 4 (subunit M)
MPDLQPREWVAVAPLVFMAVLMGVAPNLFLKPIEPAVTRMVHRMDSYQQRTVRLERPTAGVRPGELPAPGGSAR